MAETAAIDVSQWQGVINWSAVNVPIAIIKMSGGDAGLYTDSKANANYYGAKNAGKAIGGYHFAGGGNPENEADFFVACMSPLEKDDVLVLDWEREHADPVGWCTRFVNRVHERTGVWPLFYTNTARFVAHAGFAPVVANCGLWIADYRYTPAQDVPCGHPYVMHQYSSSGSVPGIAGRVDVDTWFGTVAQFRKYGWQPPVAPTATTTTTTTTVPPPITTTTTTSTTTTLPPNLDQENNNLLKQILALLQGLIAKFNNIFK